MKKLILIAIIAFSTDAFAQTWQSLTQTYSNFTSGDKKVFASPISNAVIMAYKKNATPSSSHISMDGGNTWQSVFADKPIQATLFAPNGNMYLATVKRYLSTPTYNTDSLFRSSDGINWSNLGAFGGSGLQDEGDFYVTDNNTLLIPRADGLNGLYFQKSIDNGANWTNTGYMSVGNIIQSVAASATCDTIIVGTYNSGVRYSHDGGATFSNATGGNWGTATVGGAVMLSNGNVYVAAGSSISKSTDGGVTFTGITFNPWIAMTVKEFLYHPPSGKFFAHAVQGIFESTDCITWTNITGSLTDVHLVVDMAVNQNYLFVTKSSEDNLYRYQITGTTGITEASNSNIIQVYPNPSTGFVTITNILPNSNLVITDLTGKVVYSSVISNEHTTINTTEFVNGVYIIRVENNGSIANRQLVLNRP